MTLLWIENLFAFKQCLASCTALLLHLSMGICHGFSAVLIPQLQSADSIIQITDGDMSWIASTSMMLMPVAAIFVGLLMDTFGRKSIIQLSFVPLFIGWAIISQADSVLKLCIGRIIAGIGAGMDPAVVIYIAETNLPKFRSIFLSLTGPTILIGILSSYLLGHYFYWQTAALILSVFSVVCCCACFLLPESPAWLVTQNRIQDARKSLEWLHSRTQTVDTELHELQNTKKLNDEDEMESLPLMKRIVVTKAWKPFAILSVFFALQQFAGGSVIFYYALNFYESFGTPIDSFISSIINVLLSLISSLALTAIINRYSRKTLTILSSVGVCIPCFMAAVYQYVNETNENKPAYWFPIVSMWISVGFMSLGITQLPWLMTGELFPSSVRGVMSGVMWTISYILMFLTVKMYSLVAPVIKIHGVLSVFSCASFACILFGVYILPDTRGKTMLEIERSWRDDPVT